MASMQLQFTLNGESKIITIQDDAKLLWVLRDELGLTGTKYACGIALCGACTVHVEGKPTRSCVMPARAVEGKNVVSIEGLSEDGMTHPLQKAWIELQVPQCGYCQSGQIMQAAALLNENPQPSREQIVQYMNGVLCRCGTYHRIVKAIQSASKS